MSAPLAPLAATTAGDLLAAWRCARNWVSQPDAWHAAAEFGWQQAIALHLYGAWYAGSTTDMSTSGASATSDEARESPLVHRLRAAHAASTRYSGGWTVQAIGRRGAATLTNGSELLHRLPPDYVNLARPGVPARPNDTVAVVTRRDEVDVETGWWFTFGLGGAEVHHHMVRVYWNCPASLAPQLVGAITQVTETSAVPYSLKCPWRAESYNRVDPFVLYLRRDDWSAIRFVLRDVYSRHRNDLRDATPRLALSLGRGVALAEDPSNGLSFGESRAGAVAAGAVLALAAGLEDEAAVLDILVDQLRAHGIDPDRPHLSVSTPDELVPPW